MRINSNFTRHCIFLMTFFFMISFSSCDFIESLTDNFKEKEDTEEPLNATNEIQEVLFSSSYHATANLVVAMYCKEEVDDPFMVYDNFDLDLYYGYDDSLHYGFLNDGTEYFEKSVGSKNSNFIIENFDMNISFSENHDTITYLQVYNRVKDLYFISESYRDMEFEYIINDPIPIVTTNIDAIKLIGGVTYETEMTDSSHFEFWAKESFPEVDTQFAWHYFDTKASRRYLKATVFFPSEY